MLISFDVINERDFDFPLTFKNFPVIRENPTMAMEIEPIGAAAQQVVEEEVLDESGDEADFLPNLLKMGGQ